MVLAKETNFDSMAIMDKPIKRLWRPNNYRRQLNVKTRSDSTIKKMKSAIGENFSIGKRNKLIFVKNYKGILIQYGKNTLTGIYSQKIINGEKELFSVESNNIKSIEEWILNKKNEIKNEIDRALFNFARKFNIIKSIQKPIWSRHEDWTMDEEINKLPAWTVIHGDHMKKVYPDGIEYVGGKNEEPTDQLINRIKNTGLKNFAPEIVKELELINLYNTRREALFFLKNNVESPNDVIKYKSYVKLLNNQEIDEFCNWMYDKLGN